LDFNTKLLCPQVSAKYGMKCSSSSFEKKNVAPVFCLAIASDSGRLTDQEEDGEQTLLTSVRLKLEMPA
jgi:hypothetical protein